MSEGGFNGIAGIIWGAELTELIKFRLKDGRLLGDIRYSWSEIVPWWILSVEKNKDKLTVVALREIASGKLDVNAVRHEFVQSYKEAPAMADGEESLEIGTEDPLLREIDAELEASLSSDEIPMETAEEAVEEVEESSDEE